MYLRWRRSLPSWIKVEPIELPGRGSRMDEFPVESYAALTQSLCDELVPTLPERYVLFGHSMGALLAYGIAQALRQWLVLHRFILDAVFNAARFQSFTVLLATIGFVAMNPGARFNLCFIEQCQHGFAVMLIGSSCLYRHHQAIVINQRVLFITKHRLSTPG